MNGAQSPDLPVRYYNMPAGELMTADTARSWSLGATVVVVAVAGVLGYLFWSTEKTEGPRRKAALSHARAELEASERRRSNPRRRRTKR